MFEVYPMLWRHWRTKNKKLSCDRSIMALAAFNRYVAICPMLKRQFRLVYAGIVQNAKAVAKALMEKPLFVFRQISHLPNQQRRSGTPIKTTASNIQPIVDFIIWYCCARLMGR
jgi:hypothetical protein